MTETTSPRWSTLPPPRPAPKPRRRLAPVLGPLVVLVLVWAIAGPVVAAVVAGVMALTAIAARLSPAVRQRLEWLVERVTHHVGRALTFVLLGLVQLLIFTPVALAARLLRTDPMDPLAGKAPQSRWLARAVSERDLATRPFGDERYRRNAAGSTSVAGSPRWIRGVVGGLALLVIGDIALGSVLSRFGDDDTPADDTNTAAFAFDPAAQEALADQPGSRALMNDLGGAGTGSADAFLGWGFTDDFVYTSDQVNIADGIRHTTPTAISGETKEVWFFGGSTMYGSGQSDRGTIASQVVALADAAGTPINATNFGRPAYANWQQVQLLEQELTAGDRPLPDLVVFYDGFNDLTLQTQLGVHDDPTHLFFDLRNPTAAETTTVFATVREWWADHSAVALAAGRVSDAFDDDADVQVADIDPRPIDTLDPTAAADAALAIHRRGVDTVVALSAAFEFATAFYWQPYLYTRDTPTAAEEPLVGLPGYETEVWFPMTDQVRANLREPVVDLSDALNDVEGSVYWDFVHTNEIGAAEVAAAMFATLGPRLAPAE